MRYLFYEPNSGGLAAHNDLNRSIDIKSLQLTEFDNTNCGQEKCDFLKFTPGLQSRMNKSLLTSTHTFIIYLTDCQEGWGDTVLLNSMKSSILASTDTPNPNLSGAEVSSSFSSPSTYTSYTGPESNIIRSIQPKLGRLLLFPHSCPHSGLPVQKDCKLLIRGEAHCLKK